MKPKFKKGERVHFKNYNCVFKIKEIKISEEQIAYRLTIVPPIPKDLIWLPLMLRAKLVMDMDTSLMPTHQQKQKDRHYKLNQLLK